jgi:predicted Holliday junction resolvase-like endonuclease
MEWLVFLLIIIILGLGYQLFRVNASVPDKAKEYYETWKKRDYEYIKREQRDIAQQEIEILVNERAERVAREQYESWRSKDVDSIKNQQREIATHEAREQYELWRLQNIDSIKNQQIEIATREAQVLLQQWIDENSKTIRQDAIQRSQSVITGKVTEHFIPFLPEFTFNPKDARFIGSPVDFVVFDGLDEENLREILFIEVKTGSSSLNKRQRYIKEAIKANRVRWIEMRKN